MTHWKIFLSNTTTGTNDTKYPWVKEIQVCTEEKDYSIPEQEIICLFLIDCINESIAKAHLLLRIDGSRSSSPKVH